MTIVTIQLKDVGMAPDVGPIVFRAPRARGDSAGGVTTAQEHPVTLDGDGRGEVDLSPGPVVVSWESYSRTCEVPETGPVTLAELLDNAGAFTYAPPVVGRVALDAQRAEDAADRAEAAAATVGDAQSVLAARDEAVQAASDADASAQEAATLVNGVNITFTEDPPGSGLYLIGA